MPTDTKVERREKPQYEPPVAVRLAELVAGQGACNDGSAANPHCETGSSASGECNTGNEATSCFDGGGAVA